jgi:hypothetical protein
MRIAASQSTGLDPGRRHNALLAPKPADELPRAALPAVLPGQARNNAPAASRNRPVPALLAQLIAGAEDMPNSRVRRRADPGASVDAYRAVSGLGPALPQAKSRFI